MSKTAQILELRRSGKPIKQIAALVGCSHTHCGEVCRKAGIGGAIVEQRLTQQQAADYVSRAGFDYVGGYQSGKKPITVRCRDCGRIFDRQFHIFRDVVNGTWQTANECPLCRADRQAEEREQKRILSKKKLEERRQERERVARTNAELKLEEEQRRISRQIEERLAIHVCKNCGKEYCIGSTGYNSKKYCSEKCMKRWAMRIKNDRRIRRMKSRAHDTDITLEKLFSRDGGVCYLCGKRCNWEDVDADGNAQDNYPSIDHVRPLSKGGTHTWDNVKLACRKCNTLKGSRD